jgi:hypothetical protein
MADCYLVLFNNLILQTSSATQKINQHQVAEEQ